MLVLSRKRGESIVIDGKYRVEVLEIRGHQIRLAIYAPDDVSVDREEVHLAKQRGEPKTESRPT